jgi:exodeoxyribonuclease V beta subunit
MTAFSEFDPREPLSVGRTVIEASAGTGKTFAISALVTRLIAEEGLPLDEILVVTFTRAATAELRARVRDRILMTLRALDEPRPGEAIAGSGGHTRDEHLGVLLDADPATRAVCVTRLSEALTHFDRAQIFTIHGFAQRLLAQLGLRARLSPDLEPGEPDELLLAQVASDLIVGRYATNTDEQPPAQRDVVDIARAVVGTPDGRIVPAADEVDGPARARVELAHAMRDEVHRRMQARGEVTYDDGLFEVRAALQDDEIGAAARQLLMSRYSVALVDESQDTDPIQWDIIRAVFDVRPDDSPVDRERQDGPRLVVIGDPKQSIYSFRGADIESYLAALDGADSLRTLRTNWRSDGPLLAGLDALFDGAGFGDDKIIYRPVEPAPTHVAARIHGVTAALQIRRFGPAIPINKRKRDGFFYIGDTREMVAADVAAQIVHLLSSGVTIDGPGGAEPLRPDHIAVLCRTRYQVDSVRAQLTRRTVPSVAARTGGVLASAAAEEWRRFLHGVEQAERMDRVRLAASSLLMGYTPQQLAGLTDEEALELQRRMQQWRELLYQDGVPAMVSAVDRVAGISARVLAMPDGERIMTDLAHIAEEMHAVWRRRRTGSLVGWLETSMAEAKLRDEAGHEEAESRQRRLETDAAAVQVQTIHAAKGLQWPVVMVPYGWDVATRRHPIPVFHSDEPTPAGVARQRLIDVAGKEGADFAAHSRLAAAEDAAEESRLLYVALTRAEHHLVVWWVENTDYTGNSKLNELLTRNGRTPEQVAESAPGNVEMVTVNGRPPVQQYRPEATPTGTLERARFERRLDYHWRRASFSSLSPEHPIGTGVETTEEPTRADEADLTVAPGEITPTGVSTLPMADLPRGARFGTLVHHILEDVPFDAADLEAAIGVAVDEALRLAVWDLDRDALVAGVLAAMETPLGPDPAAVRLRDLDPHRVFDELTFELPVRTDSGTVSLGDIGRVMLDHLPAADPFRRYAGTLEHLPDTRFRGFLTGAIDLTAVMPGERYVVMDYKTNALPIRGEVPDAHDYGPQQLATAMIDGNYVLQATLYQVALHRYLQWRLTGYDPARHLGGAMYLFVRGMAGPDSPVLDGERCGVARWTPPPEMITALSSLFAGGDR